MVVQAKTSAGDPVEITFHKTLAWAMGICATLVTASVLWGVATLVDVDRRVSVLETSRFTRADASAYVTLREYDAAMSSIISQLSRIEDKLDRSLEAP